MLPEYDYDASSSSTSTSSSGVSSSFPGAAPPASPLSSVPETVFVLTPEGATASRTTFPSRSSSSLAPRIRTDGGGHRVTSPTLQAVSPPASASFPSSFAGLPAVVSLVGGSGPVTTT
eukprot:GSA25T00000299001.1